MINQEYERKCLLNKAQYKKLTKCLSKICKAEEVFQINYYYDNDNYDIFSELSTLRIRQICNKLTLELKLNTSFIDEIRKCDEKAIPVSELPLYIDGNIIGDKFSGKIYKYIGNLVTQRLNFKVAGLIISLDANSYLGTTDYELEIESKKPNRFMPEEVLKIIKSFPHKTLGKYLRFVIRWKALQNKTE